MKQSEYTLISVLPPFFVIISFFAVLFKCCNPDQYGRWIAKNVFSDILKEKKKKEERAPRWLFKDIDLTSHEIIIFRVRHTFAMLFLGMLTGAIQTFWQLLLFEVSSDCDVDDPSKDCFEVTVWDWPKEDPINCSNAAIQNGTTYVLCYKIVFNFGVAIGASYGVFQLSLLVFKLSSSALLMIEKHKTLRALRIIVFLLLLLAIATPAVLKAIPFGVAFFSNNIVVILQTMITLGSLSIFVWGIPWVELTTLNATENNLNYIGFENLDAAPDDTMEIRGIRTYSSFSSVPRR